MCSKLQMQRKQERRYLWHWKKDLHIRVTPEEYDFLHELSKELDMPLNKVARLALFEGKHERDRTEIPETGRGIPTWSGT